MATYTKVPKLRRWRKQMASKNSRSYQIDKAISLLEAGIENNYDLRTVVKSVTAQLKHYEQTYNKSHN